MAYIGHSPSTGEDNNFKILDDISSYTLTFDGTDSSIVSAANDTIYAYDHRFIQGQRVTYNNGGGGNINGLSSGTAYFVIKQDHNNIKLATTAVRATSGTAIDISLSGTSGTSHTLNVAFDGTNTKFKATHTTGKKARITRGAQLVLSVNGVIQQPHDSSTPSTGFGFDLDSTIVFSQAPQSTDAFWGHILTNNNVTFDISDNRVDHFSGDGSTSSFTLSKSPPNNENILVTIDGVVQYPNDSAGNIRAYSVAANVINFTTAPGSGTQIEVRHIGFAGATSGSGGGVTGVYGRTGNVVLLNTDNITVNDAAITGDATVTGDATITGDLTVNGTTTTIDTTLKAVDRIEVADSSTNVAVAVTQSSTGSILKLFDGSSEVFSVDDGNKVGIADSIYHIGDTDTNIRFPADDTFTVHTASIERFRINSGGQVSIGTTIEGHGNADELTVYNQSNAGITIRSGASDAGMIYFSDATSGTGEYQGKFEYHHSDNSFRFSTGTNERIRIESGGDVGIGTVNPHKRLHVADYGAHGAIRVEASGNGNRSGIEFYRETSAGIGKGGAAIWVESDTSSSNGKLRFGTASNAAVQSQNTDMILDQNGQLGIGTDVPGGDLHIYDDDASARIYLTSGNSDDSSIYFGSINDTATGGIRYDHSDDSLRFMGYNNSERIRIGSTGKFTYNYDGSTENNLADVDIRTNNGVHIRGVDGNNNNANIYIGGAVANQRKIAIIHDPVGGYCRGDLHFCLENAADLTDVDVTDSKMVIKADGKVGILTATPEARLDVYDTSGLGIISRSGNTQSTDTNKALKIRNNSSTDTFNVSYKGQGYFAGKVGIGTDNPTRKLHVFGDGDTKSIVAAVAGDALFDLSNTGNGNYSGINFTRERSTGSVVGGSIFMPSVTANNSALLYLQTQTASAQAGVDSALVDNNGVRVKLASQPGGQGADTAFSVEIGSAERLRVGADGKVAIGNASPQQLLHVWPDTANTTSAYVRVTAGDRNSNTGIDIGHDASGNGHVNMVSNGTLSFSTNNAERLHISNNYARAGIGTNTFDGAGSQLKIEGRGTGTTTPPMLQIKGVGSGVLHSYVDLIATSDNNPGNSYRGLGVLMHDEPTDVEWFAGRPYAGSDAYMIGRKASPSYRTQSGESANQFLRIASDGGVRIGSAGGYSIWNGLSSDVKVRLEVRCTVGEPAGMALLEERGDSNGASFIIGKSRYGSGVGVITSGDTLGWIKFAGADGTRQHNAAGIMAWNNGTIATGRVAGNLSFYTSPDAVGSLTERVRITSGGEMQYNNGTVRYENTGGGFNQVRHLEFPIYFSSGTTHTVATLGGSYDSGLVAFATLEYIGLYSYASNPMSGGVRRAYTRRTHNNTQWRDFDDQVSENVGENYRPTIEWDSGVLKVTSPGSTQITGWMRITAHANSSSNFTLTRN